MKKFQGRVITPGEVTAEAVVTTEGFNTLASFQMALQFGDKEVKCGDQSNKQLYGKPLINKALCLPQTIGSTTGGLVLYCACAMEKNPACMLFAGHIDSLAAKEPLGLFRGAPFFIKKIGDFPIGVEKQKGVCYNVLID